MALPLVTRNESPPLGLPWGVREAPATNTKARPPKMGKAGIFGGTHMKVATQVPPGTSPRGRAKGPMLMKTDAKVARGDGQGGYGGLRGSYLATAKSEMASSESRRLGNFVSTPMPRPTGNSAMHAERSGVVPGINQLPLGAPQQSVRLGPKFAKKGKVLLLKKAPFAASSTFQPQQQQSFRSATVRAPVSSAVLKSTNALNDDAPSYGDQFGHGPQSRFALKTLNETLGEVSDDSHSIISSPPQYAPAAPPHPPRVHVAHRTGNEWNVFSRHCAAVRPAVEDERLPGQSPVLKNVFEIPPGAVPYYVNSMSHPATSWQPFVFPNPTRLFQMSFPSSHQAMITGAAVNFTAVKNVAPPPGGYRDMICCGRPEGNAMPLDDLERQLWFDPEPRLERPFRVYADSKSCMKGQACEASNLMRKGW